MPHDEDAPPPRGHRRDRQEDPDEIRKLVEEADRRRDEAVRRREDEYRRLLERWQHSDKRHDQTAWLLIRYAATDVGLRPIPAGDAFWCSPDIWVESSDAMGNPVAGEPNFLHVRIFNLGALMASPVKVDFYWANPALGLGPGDMNSIGTEYLEIPPLTSVDVRCNTAWVPVMVNDGHECVMVNCSNWILDPIIHPFQPTLDRHVGQRNLHVVNSAGAMTIQLSLQATNIFPVEMPTLIEADFSQLRAVGREGLEIPAHELGALAAGFGLGPGPPRGTAPLFRTVRQPHGAPTVSTKLGEEHAIVLERRESKHAGELLAAAGQAQEQREHPRGVVLQEFSIGPHRSRTLDTTITVPSGAKRGEILVVHLRQRAGPIVVGGYTTVVLVQ